MPSHALPPLFATWVDDLLDGPLPDETRASCRACPMCDPEDWTALIPERAFHPEVRCCTYVPDLWNFEVGAILLQQPATHPHGLATVEARIAAGEGVTPRGLGADADYNERYGWMHLQGTFGKDPSMVCPHYVAADGACGIWSGRNAVCATWFCRHERGEVGEGFWVAMRDLLSAIEKTLGFYAIRTLIGGDGWGPYEGRPADFYRAAAELVGPMRWADIADRAPDGLVMAARVARRARAVHAVRTVPATPTFKSGRVMIEDGDRVRVETFSAHDTLELPAALWEALPRFDGRPLAVSRPEVEALAGPLTDETLSRLQDYDLLE